MKLGREGSESNLRGIFQFTTWTHQYQRRTIVQLRASRAIEDSQLKTLQIDWSTYPFTHAVGPDQPRPPPSQGISDATNERSKPTLLVFALLGKGRSHENAQREGKCGQHCKLVRTLEDSASNADILYLAQSHRSRPFIILRAELSFSALD